MNNKRSRAIVPVAVVLILGLFVTGAAAQTPQPAGTVQVQPKPMGREKLYGLLFLGIAHFEALADKSAAQGRTSAPGLRDFYRKKLQLSAAQADQLKQVALPCAQQIEELNSQAAAIIKAYKDQYRGKKDGRIPPPPAELKDLEAKRTALVLAAAGALGTAWGPAQAAVFEAQARRVVGKSFAADAAHQ